VRLHSLELAGVGPFRGRQTVDFDAVSASGLFLIEGPTGAGKTTIIDAIVYALYGSLSGAESDASRMRSQLCDSDERTEITLDFSVGGVRHTITRNPPYERRKARGEGTTLERAAQTLRVHDDAIPDMREAREIGIYLQQRIGLNADQFRRLVVLPQGEFDTLLRAKPRDRYDTVAGLIDDGYLQRVQEDLRRQADEAQQSRGAAEADVSRILGVMRERAGEVVAIDDDFDTDAVIADIGARAEAALAAATSTKATLEAAQAHEHAARVQAEAALAASAARTALEQASAHAGAEIAGLDDAGLQSLSVELVTQRTRLEPVVAWEADAHVRERESIRLHAHAAELAQRIADARAQAAAMPARRQDAQAALADAQSLAGAAESLEAELTRLEGLQSSLVEREGIAQEAEAVRARLLSATDVLQGARNALHEARTAQHALVITQLDQRAAHLASMLVSGESCPVCGSLEHPSPAHDSSASLVTDADVTAADQRSARAERDEAEAAASVESVRASLTALEQQLAVIDARLDGVTHDAVSAALAEARTGLEQAQAAADRLPTLAETVTAIDAEAASSASTIEGLVADEATAQAEARAYDVAVAAETERYRAEVGADGTAAEALAAIDDRLATVEALQAARAAAAGQPVDADPAAAEAALAQATLVRTQSEVQHAETDQLRLRLADARTALTSHAADLGQAQALLDAVGQTTEAAIRLGDLVTARSAANRRRLTLQAYAVQRRFQSVLEAASVHLERMSSGKFTFVIDEQAAGRAQSGLGIDILDAWTGRTRDPESLSGGETFYASLSLALGLADIVREESGGVSLDTLFVDEGFGSLDADTLTVVLDQLDALRSRGRVVGVISHVAEMKEWVHDRILVEPGRPGAGSTISQTG
jgi:DNA repair protein SbcC/Rad50